MKKLFLLSLLLLAVNSQAATVPLLSAGAITNLIDAKIALATNIVSSSNVLGSLNILSLGGIKDGTGDNTTVVSNALILATAQQKLLYFPSGTYRFATQLSWPLTTNTGFIGDGPKFSKLVFDFGGAPERTNGLLTFASGLGRYKITASTYGGALNGSPDDFRTWGADSNAVGVVFMAGGAATNVTLTAGGSGYGTAPTVTFDAPFYPGSTHAALGYATVGAGIVTGVVITNGGTGYTTNQVRNITFTGGGGTGATATFAVSDGLGSGLLSTTRRVLDLDVSNGSGILINPSSTDTNATIRGITFRDISFHAKDPGNTGGPFDLLLFGNNWEDVLFQNCEISTNRHSGLRTSVGLATNEIIGYRMTLRNCTFSDSQTTNSDTIRGSALLYAGGEALTLDEVTFIRCGDNGTSGYFAHGAYIQYATNYTFRNCNFIGTSSRLGISQSDNRNGLIVGNRFDGQYLNYVSGTGISVVGNLFRNTTIRFSQVTDVNITGNRFDSDTVPMVFIENISTSNDRVLIQDNDFSFHTTNTLDTGVWAINSNVASPNWIVQGNRVVNQCLINLALGDTNVVVSGNTILAAKNNHTQGYITLVQGGLIRDNQFYFPTPSVGARAIEVNTFGITNTVCFGNYPTNITCVGTTNKLYTLTNP